jgi:rhodanese-related sulfurtransferase
MSNSSTVSFAQNSYAGDVMPSDAWELMVKENKAELVDVRTSAEWAFVGTPDLRELGKEPVFLSWRVYPTMEVNASFIEILRKAVPDTATPLLFLCKTGGRSHDAAVAATQAGYTRCYNIAYGFEGEPDAYGHRGTINGWKAANLAWEQR